MCIFPTETHTILHCYEAGFRTPGNLLRRILNSKMCVIGHS